MRQEPDPIPPSLFKGVMDVVAALVLDKNPGGGLTASKLKLATLVIHEDTLPYVCPDANMFVPL